VFLFLSFEMEFKHAILSGSLQTGRNTLEIWYKCHKSGKLDVELKHLNWLGNLEFKNEKNGLGIEPRFAGCESSTLTLHYSDLMRKNDNFSLFEQMVRARSDVCGCSAQKRVEWPDFFLSMGLQHFFWVENNWGILQLKQMNNCFAIGLELISNFSELSWRIEH
jgi:hypothetical protein